MSFSENRLPLFRDMRYLHTSARQRTGQHSCWRSPHATYPVGHAHAVAVVTRIVADIAAAKSSRHLARMALTPLQRLTIVAHLGFIDH
jgi:hypothetical protein